MKKLLLLLIAICCATPGATWAYTLFSREYGRSGCDVDVDPYYSSIEVFTGLAKEPRPHLGETSEKEIYRYLFQRAFLPRVLLVEFSCYPMPCLGVAIKRNLRDHYDRVQVSETTNLVNLVCEGFQEPYATSLFLGNLVSFTPKGAAENISGKAYMGYLVSAGNYHIKDSNLIEDHWAEIEWKIKGERITDKRKMKWSYRIGTKQHDNPYIMDVMYFSVSRDRVDFEEGSFLNNAGAEYTVDFDYRKMEAVRHFFLVGKSFPTKKKYAFKLQVGFIWERGDIYTGPLQRLNGKDDFGYIFRPNIVF